MKGRASGYTPGEDSKSREISAAVWYFDFVRIQEPRFRPLSYFSSLEVLQNIRSVIKVLHAHILVVPSSSDLFISEADMYEIVAEPG